MASNRTFRCGFSVVSCPPRSTHTSPLASLAIGQALRVLQTTSPVGHWTLTAAPGKALAAAVAYNVLWIAVSATSAATTTVPRAGARRRWSRRRCQPLSRGLTSSSPSVSTSREALALLK
jgi:hypothetical protein